MFDADLTNDQIALLCDIGEFDPEKDVSGNKRRDLDVLLSRGYVEPAESHIGSRFKLTGKATYFLSARGVGLNES